MADRTYEVRVTGPMPNRELLDELGDVEIAEHEVRTVLSARFPDQAALYGFLHRLRAFGLEVVEVRRLSSGHVVPEPSAEGVPEPSAQGVPEPGAERVPEQRGKPG